ncbi:MAG: dihydropteroate synthase [Planctomycetes bacterium]|nr:dihydropteroate synthase [Planctomycetota bacterium]
MVVANDGALKLGAKTLVMGVLNVTPDSFSDGGQHFAAEAAVRHGLEMVEAGADIIDVGGESTRPGAETVPETDEIRRVVPVIEALMAKATPFISIDTYKPAVAAAALDAGARMVNDVNGLRDAKMMALVARRGVPAVIMHMQGMPRDMQKNPTYADVVGDILAFLRAQIAAAVRAGVAAERLIVDPGIGFGKTVAHNLEILRRLDEFRSLGRPVMIGTSRKSFIGQVLGVPVEQRLMGTAATVAWAVAKGAKIVRVHDVREAVQVVRMCDAIKAEA